MTDSIPSPDRRVLPPPRPAPPAPTAIDARDQDPAFAPEQPVRPPAGAPNVLVILVDDMGFGAPSAFGGPCEMPVADRLAEGGLRYTRFHTTAICSSTRAALLTGRNHHTVGFGAVVDWANSAPGYNGRRPANTASVARVLGANGYATGVFGKWHLTPREEITSVGPFNRWPVADGFDKFYGFNGGENSGWYPALLDGTTPVQPPCSPEDGYHFSADIVDKAVGWVRDVRAITPGRPFFCHLAFGATHAPLHVGREWIEKYRGRFDEGWDVQRERTLERQKALGVVPDEAELSPWASTIPSWDDLEDNAQEAAALLMEVYAGYAEHMDAQVGRLVDALEADGILDDTLVFYILGDNGASSEGALTGTVNQYFRLNSGADDTPESIIAQREVLGGPETWPQYPVGWALAMDSPYQWTKHIASHYGGTRNGMIVHWPNGIAARGELRHQWHHVIDVVPTILEAAGLPQPEIVDEVAQNPIEGTAMNYTFDGADAEDRHRTQYFEICGSRGIYRDGWTACTPHWTRPWDFHSEPPALHEEQWELYDTRSDWTQARDLAADHPEKLAELKELFMLEAGRHQVFPIHDLPLSKRHVASGARKRPAQSMTFHPGVQRLQLTALPPILNASHVITAQVTVPEAGASGVICAQGGLQGGWSLYCTDGVLSYCHNLGAPPLMKVRGSTKLAPGQHQLRYEFVYDGEGLGKGGLGKLFVDDVQVGEGRLEKTLALVFPVGEGFAVGVDDGTAVSDEYPTGDNAFSGTIEWVRIDGGVSLLPSVAHQEQVDLALQ